MNEKRVRYTIEANPQVVNTEYFLKGFDAILNDFVKRYFNDYTLKTEIIEEPNTEDEVFRFVVEVESDMYVRSANDEEYVAGIIHNWLDSRFKWSKIWKLKKEAKRTWQK